MRPPSALVTMVGEPPSMAATCGLRAGIEVSRGSPEDFIIRESIVGGVGGTNRQMDRGGGARETRAREPLARAARASNES